VRRRIASEAHGIQNSININSGASPIPESVTSPARPEHAPGIASCTTGAGSPGPGATEGCRASRGDWCACAERAWCCVSLLFSCTEKILQHLVEPVASCAGDLSSTDLPLLHCAARPPRASAKAAAQGHGPRHKQHRDGPRSPPFAVIFGASRCQSTRNDGLHRGVAGEFSRRLVNWTPPRVCET
jgi:hypothetical protein